MTFDEIKNKIRNQCIRVLEKAGIPKEKASVSGVIDECIDDLEDKLNAKQGTLTAGEHITITADNVISCDGGEEAPIQKVKVNGTELPIASDKSVNIDISGKVDKVAGKGLSTNDFTDALKSRLENDVVLQDAFNDLTARVTALETTLADVLDALNIDADNDQ